MPSFNKVQRTQRLETYVSSHLLPFYTAASFDDVKIMAYGKTNTELFIRSD